MDQDTVEAIPRASPTALLGRVVDSRFELFDYIGSGETTHVFRAWDQRLQHVVAVKVLDPRFALDAGVAQAFEEGGRRVANLPRHPNIVPIYEAGTDGDLHYIATEFVPGKNLRTLIANEAPLEVDRAFRICRQVALALDFAHQYGLVHQDVQPGNIMVTPRDEVKVTDFGLAGATDPSDLGRTRVIESATPYLSPAQALGGSPRVDSDVYSLGVVLYEMLTGSPPFQDDNPVVLATKQTREAPPDMRQANPAVSPVAAAVVLRALTWEPERQYGSASAFASALQDYLLHEKGDTPVSVPPNQIARDGATTTPQRPSLVPAATAEEAQPAVRTPAPSNNPPRAVYVAPKAPSRPRWRPWATLAFLATIGIGVAGGWFAYKAIWKALNGSNSPPPAKTGKQRTGTPHHSTGGAQRAGSRAKIAAPASKHRSSAASCTSASIGPLGLVTIWAEEVHPVAGHTVKFDYTINNGSGQCRNVLLGLTAYPSGQQGAPLTYKPQDIVVHTAPGTHVYKRTFLFPPASAGQTYDVALTISDPSGAREYGRDRENALITVVPR